MVKMETTEPSVILKLKKGGHVAVNKDANGHTNMKSDAFKAKYSDEGIRSAVTLSSRYLTARFLPDKAIDIMDEAGSKARIGAMTRPPELKEIDAEIEAIRARMEQIPRDLVFEDTFHNTVVTEGKNAILTHSPP
jgi:ATP-dependent Clp protease ATP-binding subunit ClpA